MTNNEAGKVLLNLMDTTEGITVYEAAAIGLAIAALNHNPGNEPHELLTEWETPKSCPNCMEHLSLDWSYCPNCGAKMDKEDIT